MRRGAAALLPFGLLTACGELPKPAPSNPASIEVQYEDGAKPAVPPPGEALAYWKGRKDLIRAPAPPVPAELNLPRVDRWKLKNGLDVVVVARKDLPVVSFSIAVKAGAYDEEKAKTLGVASFTASMLRKGTEKRTADQISEAIDYVGGSLDTQAASESSSASCT